MIHDAGFSNPKYSLLSKNEKDLNFTARFAQGAKVAKENFLFLESRRRRDSRNDRCNMWG